MGFAVWSFVAAVAGMVFWQDPTRWSQAEANRSRMTTAPKFIDGPKAELSEQDKARGYHGVVVVRGVIATDGTMKDARIGSSIGVPSLEQSALRAATASRFQPARAADGSPVAVVISMPFDFSAAKAPGGGLRDYRCGQFVKDMDWWRSVNPAKPFGDHELYKMELGMMVLPLMRGAKIDGAAIKGKVSEFEQRWTAAIATCRAKPEMRQVDAIYR